MSSMTSRPEVSDDHPVRQSHMGTWSWRQNSGSPQAQRFSKIERARDAARQLPADPQPVPASAEAPKPEKPEPAKPTAKKPASPAPQRHTQPPSPPPGDSRTAADRWVSALPASRRSSQDVPDNPIRLPEGWLACRTCGIAVQRTSDVGEEIHLTSSGRAVEGLAVVTEAVRNQKPIPLVFMLCPDHRRTAELAVQLVDQSNHPAYRDRMGCALDALSFVAPTTVEHMAYLDREGLATLVRHLG